MPSVSQDRRQGVNAGAALKVPVRVATTANITLSGLQTIDGVTVVADDRVLVKNQTDASENGIYSATTSTWQRTPDWDGPFDVVEGTLVYVNQGTLNTETMWRVTTTGEITIGEDDIAFETAVVNSASSTAYQPASSSSVASTVQSKLREVVSAFDFMTSAQITDVIARTLTQDVTSALNTAFAYGSNNDVAIYLPAGTYKVTSTLWVTPSGSTFQSAHIFGAGGGNTENDAQTIINASTITSHPAMNIFRARGVYLGHFLVLGGNKEMDVDMDTDDLLYTASYVTSGFRDSRYSPHCGIAIDAGVGSAPPDGGYSGFTYAGSSSGTSHVCFDNVNIRRFVVGLMHNPESNATQGDVVQLRHCNITNTKVAIASGQAQARCVDVIGGTLGWCRTCSEGMEYGQRQGSGVRFIGTQFGPAFEMFAHAASFSSLYLLGVRAESVHRIGQGGQGAANSGFPITLIDPEIHLLNSGVGKFCPIVLDVADTVVNWTGGFLACDAGTSQDVDGAVALFLSGTPVIINGATFNLRNPYRAFIGGAPDINYPVELRNCRVVNGSTKVFVGNEFRGFSVSGRITEHWSAGFRRAGRTLYTFVPGCDNTYINIGTSSSFSFSATTLTFSNTDAAGGLVVGDVIYWQMDAVGSGTTQYVIPAAIITSISAPTVTCSLLFDRSYYDESYSPSTTQVAVAEWAPGQALTGDTNSNTSLTNVSPTTILQVGDWITAASGIPANTRVTAVSGSTVTLSRNATDTAVGKTLYWGRLHTFTTTAAF